MKSNEHKEINFLIKAFARYATIAEATILFREQYGKDPTAWQIGVTNLGRFINDRRGYFNPQENHRVRRFRIEREKYEASKDNLAIASQTWRMEQYQHMYHRTLARAEVSGNFARPMDILTLAAKDAGGAYTPKVQNITVDNRSVNINMSDEEINRRIKNWLNDVGVNAKDLPLLDKGAKVVDIIDYERKIDDEQN